MSSHAARRGRTVGAAAALAAGALVLSACATLPAAVGGSATTASARPSATVTPVPTGSASGSERSRYAEEAGDVCREHRRSALRRSVPPTDTLSGRAWESLLNQLNDATVSLGFDLGGVRAPEADESLLDERLVRQASAYGESVISWLDAEGTPSSQLTPRTLFEQKRALDGFARAYGVAECVDVAFFAPASAPRAQQRPPSWGSYVAAVEDMCMRVSKDVAPKDGLHSPDLTYEGLTALRRYWAVLTLGLSAVPAPEKASDVARIELRLLDALRQRQSAVGRVVDVAYGRTSPTAGIDEDARFAALVASEARVSVAFERMGMHACAGRQVTETA